MATSFRKRLDFSPTLATEDELSQSDRSKEKRASKPRKVREKLHSAPDRYGFAHLAGILVSGERNEMLNAVDRLRGRSRILVELACFSNFQFVRLAAISHLIHETEALMDVAKYCQYDDTRAAAVDDLSMNAEALVSIACSSLFKDTRLDAVSLLFNPNSLAQVAARSPNTDSRSAAIEKIASEPLALKKVSEESPHRSARIEAVKKLTSDSNALCALLISSKHSDVKKIAASLLSGFVEELEDVEALTEIAKLSQSQDARYLAVGRLWRHPLALRKIVFDSRYRDARSTALMLLSDMVSHLDDSDLLAEVAMLSPYEDCRSAAIDRLVGQSAALLSVASKSKFRDARQRALEKLRGDVEALKNVSRLSKYRDTRLQAHKIVASPEVFQSELSRILG